MYRWPRSFTSYSDVFAIAVLSSMRISSAKDSVAPLCGVAEARIRASVCSARARARSLFLVPRLTRLCDSSMTTASQWEFSRWCA
ncbi:hypothetical protein SMICM17S_00345 [Streptomyces microflavus]